MTIIITQNRKDSLFTWIAIFSYPVGDKVVESQAEGEAVHLP